MTVELQQDAYSIREDEGAIQICIDTFGDLNEGENAVVTLTTIEDSAERKLRTNKAAHYSYVTELHTYVIPKS